MGTAAPIPEYLKPERRIPREPSEFWKELSYVPREEELYDVMYGPEGYAKPRSVTGGIGRMIRKNILDPFYKGGLVTGRAKRGQPPTPLELLEVSALGALPRVSGGLGSGPGLARPFRSRLLTALKEGKIGKRELGKSPKAQSLEAAIRSGGFHPSEVKYSGIMEELRAAAPGQRVLMHDVVAKAEKNLPIPLKKTVLSEEKSTLSRKVSDALASEFSRRVARTGELVRMGNKLLNKGVRPEDPGVEAAALRRIVNETRNQRRGLAVLNKAITEREPSYQSMPQYTQYATPGGTKHKETLYHWEPPPSKLIPGDIKQGYKPREFISQHFSGHEKNLLAHTLTDIRTVEGKQVTNLSEIQSDWLQRLAAGDPVPEAPFRRDWYKVLGRDLVNQAIEEGSTGITWSTSEILSSRYSPTYQKFYQDLYDKKIPGFFKKEYGVKPVKVKAQVAPKGRTTVDRLQYEGTRPDEWIVEGFDMAEDPYGSYMPIFPEPSMVEWMDTMGLPQDTMRRWLNMGEASFLSEGEANNFQQFLDLWYKEHHPFEDDLWYVPITDKMKQLVKEGQFQAATPRKREEAVV